MIRRVQFSLNSSNALKLAQLDTLMTESLRVINVFIAELWLQGKFSGSFTKLKTDTWLSARMQQCLGKQALETVKSQRKRRRKTMPTVTRRTLNLDGRFISVAFDINSFDMWIKLTSLGAKLRLDLPSRKHRHFNTFVKAGWTLKKSARLRRADTGWFIDLYMHKDAPALKSEGTALGIDCGYKKLIACSDGNVADAGLEQCYTKIARKRQGSNAFKRALTERDQLINKSVNNINFRTVSAIVVEALCGVKHRSKGRIYKKFNNKLQRWSYRKVFDKLRNVCDESGIEFLEVDPAYTSQTCSSCGCVDKESRQGESFRCTQCNMIMDADINAAINIMQRGTYSSPSLQPRE